MNWDLERHDWARISNQVVIVPQLLEQLVSCSDADQADWLYWQLDFLLVHNQVVKPGSAEAATYLVQVLPMCTAVSRVWVLELLAQFASGSMGRTAALPHVVEALRQALVYAIPQAAQILQYGNENERYHCVDILEACFDIAPEQRKRIRFLFDKFANSGPNPRKRVDASPVSAID